MLKVLIVCAAAAAVVAQNSSEQGDTRIFGLGNLLSGLAGGRPNRPNRPFRPNRPGGFNQGFNQGGFNQGGFHQGGFNQGGFHQGGFNQGGFNQGGFNQGGFNQGGFNQGFQQPGFQIGSLIGGLASGFLGGRPPFQGGGFGRFKPGQCPAVRPSCPDTRLFGAPQPCSQDFSCSGSDKCCFDTCLRQRVCKPAQQFGR